MGNSRKWQDYLLRNLVNFKVDTLAGEKEHLRFERDRHATDGREKRWIHSHGDLSVSVSVSANRKNPLCFRSILLSCGRSSVSHDLPLLFILLSFSSLLFSSTSLSTIVRKGKIFYYHKKTFFIHSFIHPIGLYGKYSLSLSFVENTQLY